MKLPQPLLTLLAFLERHERLLWTLHSLWALGLGIVVMWLGSRHYAWLRVTLFYLAFLWVTSLFVPALVDDPDTRRGGGAVCVSSSTTSTRTSTSNCCSSCCRSTGRAPPAGRSTCCSSPCSACSALISTLDVFYDRHLSVRRGLLAVFFAFNLFACINVMLPVLWGISNRVALPLSAGLAVAAFATIRYRLRDLASFPVRRHVGIAAIALVLLVALGRPLIPPAPLKVLRADFGGGIDRRDAAGHGARSTALPAGWSGRVYAVTAIYAPLGLRDRLEHRWYQDGRLVYSSPSYLVAGGRGQGFRLWTSGRS